MEQPKAREQGPESGSILRALGVNCLSPSAPTNHPSSFVSLFTVPSKRDQYVVVKYATENQISTVSTCHPVSRSGIAVFDALVSLYSVGRKPLHISRGRGVKDLLTGAGFSVTPRFTNFKFAG
jgi:hypothetical protein